MKLVWWEHNNHLTWNVRSVSVCWFEFFSESYKQGRARLQRFNLRIVKAFFFLFFFTTSSESVDHIIKFLYDHQPWLSSKYTSTHRVSAEIFHLNTQLLYLPQQTQHSSWLRIPQKIRFSSIQLFTTSFEPSQASSYCHERQSSNKQDADKVVHCDAISKVRPEGFIYTWPIAWNYF